MRKNQQQDNFHSKQRLRMEISNQTEDYLHKGGRISVVSGLPQTGQHARGVHRSAAAVFPSVTQLPGE
jgi:translation elongation factor EF-Ts